MEFTYFLKHLDALKGGLLIGFATGLFLLFNGRLTGISNLLSRLVSLEKTALSQRGLFIFGLILGGAYMSFQHPELFINSSGRMNLTLAVAGLFVGFGTAMANGCTSGHGICGVGRFSKRSLVATAVFILTGILTATGFHYLLIEGLS